MVYSLWSNKIFKEVLAVFIVLLWCGACFAQVENVEKALVLKNYTEVIRLAEDYLDRNIQDKDKILFILGEAYIGSSNLVKARETLRCLYKQYPSSIYAQKSVLRIADSYYLESNYNQAKKVYNYFLDKYQDNQFLPYIYLKLAYCEEKLGNWSYKRKYMDLIGTQFPRSIEAQKIAELEKRGFNFVIQIGAFTDRVNAQELALGLKRDGFLPYLVEEKEDGKLFYKVRIGKFLEHNKAEAELESLIKKGYPARIFP